MEAPIDAWVCTNFQTSFVARPMSPGATLGRSVGARGEQRREGDERPQPFVLRGTLDREVELLRRREAEVHRRSERGCIGCDLREEGDLRQVLLTHRDLARGKDPDARAVRVLDRERQVLLVGAHDPSDDEVLGGSEPGHRV